MTEREDVCSKQNYADRECESLWTASDGHCHSNQSGRLLFPTVKLRGQPFVAFSQHSRFIASARVRRGKVIFLMYSMAFE